MRSVYPIPLGQRLRGDWFALHFRDLLSSRWRAIVEPEAGFYGVMLWCQAAAQDPAGTLPTDDRELANLAGFGRDLDGWLRVRDGALYGWEEVVCTDEVDELVRLGHPRLTEAVLEAVERIEKKRDGLAEGTLRKRLSRLRRAMRKTGLSDRAANDERLQEQILDWLDGRNLTMRVVNVREALVFHGLRDEMPSAQVADLERERARRGEG